MPRLALACAVFAAAVPTTVLAASGDPSFIGALTFVSDWLTGWLGKLLAMVALITGMGVAVATQSQMARLTSMVIALAAAFGPGVIETVFAATL